LDQIADALDAAHAKGVVHRDLKPDNVMLSGDPPKVHVLDFGIAKLLSTGDAPDPGALLTGQGAWIGTPGYMAPEQWSADGAGPASDRYALGVMAYELLSGKLPFQAPTLPQMMEQHFRAPVPALSASGTLVELTAFDPVVARAMAKDPDARFPTARELVAALQDAATGKRLRSSRKRWAPAAAGVAMLAATLGGVLIARDDPDNIADEPAPAVREPHAGFVQVAIESTPSGARVMRIGDGPERALSSTPAQLELREGQPVALAIRKPGYLAVRHQLTPTRDERVRIALQPVTGFEGVWTMPDGQLRELARNGDQVDVYKRAAVTGPRELWRKFTFVDGTVTDEVTFATDAEMVAEGASADPSCRLTHRIEYHYQLANQTLEVQAERIETGKRADGGCFVVTRVPGVRRRLRRADRDTITHWTEPPVGIPVRPRPRPARQPAQNSKAPPGKLSAPPPPDLQQQVPQQQNKL
ncbi:MAG: serine/threonine-protein kinase, partial [Kofleriaceae bacterium]